MYVVAAQYQAKEGKDDEIAAILKTMIPISRGGAGVRALHRESIGPGSSEVPALRAVSRQVGLRGAHGHRAVQGEHPRQGGADAREPGRLFLRGCRALKSQRLSYAGFRHRGTRTPGRLLACNTAWNPPLTGTSWSSAGSTPTIVPRRQTARANVARMASSSSRRLVAKAQMERFRARLGARTAIVGRVGPDAGKGAHRPSRRRGRAGRARHLRSGGPHRRGGDTGR